MRSLISFLIVVIVLCATAATAVPFSLRTPTQLKKLSAAETHALDETYDWDHPTYAEVRRKLEKNGVRSNCTLSHFTVPLDHFGFKTTSPQSFQIRIYTCMEENWTAGQPIFYYTGNEAPIEFFMRWSGLLWENAKAVGAKIVWAEHRYFGRSRPWANESMPSAEKLKFLTPDQALADYNDHINYLRYTATPSAKSSAIIGFGGSYGGLLCAWMRGKYPYALDGCVASSAPVAMFDGVHPPLDKDHLVMIVTKDATSARGASAGCSDNIRQAFKVIADMGQTTQGLQELSTIFKTCQPMTAAAGGSAALMGWVQSGLIAMAQSSFPYPNNLMLLGGAGEMPAYPLHATCKFLGGNNSFATNRSLLSALASGMEVYFNASNSSTCNDLDFSFPPSKVGSVVVYLWQYIACTTVMLASESNGVTDMFFPNPYNRAAQVQACQSIYSPDLEPEPEYCQLRFGGRSIGAWSSNTVFSNGGYDPIRAGSLVNRTDVPNPTNIPLVFPALGHTGDLAFSNSADSEAVKAMRVKEVSAIQSFIAAKKKSQ